MSRRFGVAEGVLAGMAAASGDAVVYMDADLQDPPEVIPALLARWRAGADVVHTVRTRRHGENALKMWATADRLPRHPVRLDDRAAGRRRRLQAAVAARSSITCSSCANPIRTCAASSSGSASTQAFVPVRARRAPRRPDALSRSSAAIPGRRSSLGLTSFSFLPIYACAGARGRPASSCCSARCSCWPRVASRTRWPRLLVVPLGDDDGGGRGRRPLRHPHLQGRARPPALHRRVDDRSPRPSR